MTIRKQLEAKEMQIPVKDRVAHIEKKTGTKSGVDSEAKRRKKDKQGPLENQPPLLHA